MDPFGKQGVLVDIHGVINKHKNSDVHCADEHDCDDDVLHVSALPFSIHVHCAYH